MKLIINHSKEVYNIVKEPQKNHYKRWKILGHATGAPELEAPAQTYDEEVERLKEWIAIRLDWLDAHMVGSNEDCDPSAIEDVENDVKLRVFPNPAITNVYVEAVKIIDMIQLLDISGIVVKTYFDEGIYSWNLNVSDLEKGMYFVKVHFNDNRVYVRKIMIK